MKILTNLAGAGLLALGLIAPAAAQQDFPTRPITWVVPFAPGGVTDNAARFLAKGVGDRLGQPVIVENKQGAGGIVGSEYVASAKPDGYTLLYGSSGPMSTIPATRKALSYDPIKSFTPLYGLSSAPLILVVNANKPYKTFAEFVEHAKKNPGKLNFASIGQAAAQHLAGELFAMSTQTEVVHIPYKNTPLALADILSGTIDFMFEFSVNVKPFIDSGQLRGLIVTSDQRLSSLPDVPTATDLKYPNMVFNPWSTVVMPKNAPKNVSDKLIAAFAETLKEPATLKYFETTGSQALPPLPGEKLTSFFESESAKLKGIVEKAKIPIE